jgi:hypothetical protein
VGFLSPFIKCQFGTLKHDSYAAINILSTLKIKVILSSETSVHVRTIWRYVPEDGTTHPHLPFTPFDCHSAGSFGHSR